MSNIIEFKRRDRDDEGDGLIYCACGDAWWVLITGAVNFRPNLTISGWTGIPLCNSCQAPMPGHQLPTVNR